MSGYRLRDLIVLLAALVVPFLVALALVPFRTDLSSTNEALILVVAVVAVGAAGTRAAGVVAALSAAVWFDFFLTRPYNRFTIDDRAELETAVLLLVVGLVVGQLAVRTRRLEAETVTEAGHLTRLQETARLAEDSPPEEVVEHVRRELIGLLELRDCRFEYGTLLGHRPRLEHDGGLWLRLGDRITEYADWPDGETELRVVGGGHYYGRYLLDPRPGPLPPEQARLVAVALAAQVGGSLNSAGMSPQG
ncbi:histidine kinase [Streptomyces venezuelae]|uniref:Histidine kinase n=1 Tax=Streptomyces venezuelae TaxID=54571 RepID=A0A5P2DDL0_STRVZ|nr:DUF4118 domain-containing protein [Streptomyces venezuelae]QES51341.1 histidine kinase [Streptomyces venezuelae]